MRTLFITIAIGLTLTEAHAETVRYVMIVGNNAPPMGDETALMPLRYADDDAVRYFRFFEKLTDKTALLTNLDLATQARYRGLSSLAQRPTLTNIVQTVTRFQNEMKQDLRAGNQPIFYFIFSGHGARDENGEAYLAVLDGKVTRDFFESHVLQPLQAEYTHLIIDACNAGAFIGARGADLEVAHVQLTEEDLVFIGKSELGRKFPGLGIITSTGGNQETHEWSRIESGIFTHEVISGLSGPADVNHDNIIEYSEIHAFISSANRDIKDPRAKPHVVVLPPSRNVNTSIIDLREFKNVLALQGDPSQLGHFYVELTNGERYLDANLGDVTKAMILLPDNTPSYLRLEDEEVLIEPEQKQELQTIQLASLTFTPHAHQPKGSIDAEWQTNLFRSPFGPTYYKGFIDHTGYFGVTFESNETETPEAASSATPESATTGSEPTRSKWSMSLAVGTGVGLLTSKSWMEDETTGQTEEQSGVGGLAFEPLHLRYSVAYLLTPRLQLGVTFRAGFAWYDEIYDDSGFSPTGLVNLLYRLAQSKGGGYMLQLLFGLGSGVHTYAINEEFGRANLSVGYGVVELGGINTFWLSSHVGFNLGLIVNLVFPEVTLGFNFNSGLSFRF